MKPLKAILPIILGIVILIGASLIFYTSSLSTNEQRDSNVETCKNISNNTEKTLCEDRFFWASAINDSNIETCEKISSKTFQENCKLTITFGTAILENDENICDTIVGDNYKLACIDNVYFNRAIASLTTDSCANINFEPLQESCKKRIEDTLKNNDSTICEQLMNTDLKDECEKTFLEN